MRSVEFIALIQYAHTYIIRNDNNSNIIYCILQIFKTEKHIRRLFVNLTYIYIFINLKF